MCGVRVLLAAMWCTRWFLPLLLLPVPTTRPYFLVLYLISAFFHARPCAYCILILVGLFVTSCYWSPIPMSGIPQSTLATLNATEQEAAQQLTSIEMISRCWCDFQRTPFFGYYNVTEWEADSIRMAIEAANITQTEPSKEEEMSESEVRTTTSHATRWFWTRPKPNPRASHKMSTWTSWMDRLHGNPAISVPQEDEVEQVAEEQVTPAVEPPKQKEPWLRWKYDLRPHGIDLIIDFGWRR